MANESDLLAALHADLRKSAHEAWAGEIGFVLSDLRHALRHLAVWMKPQRRRTPLIAWPARGFVQPEPFGVALIIGPWNYPLQLLLSPLVGAMAAGNCIVLKPSEFAAHTAAEIAQLIKANCADDYVAVAQGECEVAEVLLRERFDKIFFTGSTTVGRSVMAAAAQHLTPVTSAPSASKCAVSRRRSSGSSSTTSTLNPASEFAVPLSTLIIVRGQTLPKSRGR